MRQAAHVTVGMERQVAEGGRPTRIRRHQEVRKTESEIVPLILDSQNAAAREETAKRQIRNV
jgi:hypothetical protein